MKYGPRAETNLFGGKECAIKQRRVTKGYCLSFPGKETRFLMAI